MSFALNIFYCLTDAFLKDPIYLHGTLLLSAFSVPFLAAASLLPRFSFRSVEQGLLHEH
jgi:hypothetical protein